MNKSKVKVKTKVGNEVLVNKHTGEILEQSPSSSFYIEETKDAFVVSSKNYVSITPEAIEYLTIHCKNTDIAKILMISATTRTDFSVAFHTNNKPHSIETLSKYLNLNERELYRLINRLTKQNILAYAVCAPSGYLQKIIMLNPYIARRRTQFADELNVIFSDITNNYKKKYPSTDSLENFFNPKKNDTNKVK
jgi:hypothetical protein